MAKKKQLDEGSKEIKGLLKKKTLVIGTDRSMKSIKAGTIQKVFLSSTCPAQLKDDIKHYAQVKEFEVVELAQTNEELGVLCKKPFNISVVALKKGEE